MAQAATDRQGGVAALGGRDLLFCVGAQKAGTSWLHSYFDTHPEIHVPQCKEMHFFDNLYGPEKGNFAARREAHLAQRIARGEEDDGVMRFPSLAYSRALVEMHEDTDPGHGRYAALLSDGAGDAHVVADITPSYALVGEEGFRAMLDFAPEARFLFVLRDPVARVWSSIRMGYEEMQGTRRGAKLRGPGDLVERFLDGGMEHIHRRSRYGETVAALDAVVPEAQLQYMFFEQMFDPREIHRLTEFVGIEPRAAKVGQAVREGVPHKLPETLAARLREALAPEYEAMEARFGAAIPAKWRAPASPAAKPKAPAPARGARDDITWLFCLGAQKAGTTWLYDYFLSHPQVHVPPVKEMHYFNVLWDPRQAEIARRRREALEAQDAKAASLLPVGAAKSLVRKLAGSAGAAVLKPALPGEVESVETLQALVDMHDSDEPDHAAYRRFMLQGAGDAKVVADITPDYCTLGARALSDMQASFPTGRFLFILRDPVERTWSNLKMHRGFLADRGLEDLSVDELLARLVAGRQQHILQRSSYQKTLFAMKRFIPEHRRLYLFYETLFSDEAMHELCDFLGVDFHAGNYGKRVRSGQSSGMTDEQRLVLRALTAHIYRPMINAFGDRLPEAWDIEAANATPEDIENTAIGRRAQEFLAELEAERERQEAEAAQAPRLGMTGGT